MAAQSARLEPHIVMEAQRKGVSMLDSVCALRFLPCAPPQFYGIHRLRSCNLLRGMRNVPPALSCKYVMGQRLNIELRLNMGVCIRGDGLRQPSQLQAAVLEPVVCCQLGECVLKLATKAVVLGTARMQPKPGAWTS